MEGVWATVGRDVANVARVGYLLGRVEGGEECGGVAPVGPPLPEQDDQHDDESHEANHQPSP